MQRFTYIERVTHWVVAVTFVLLLLSGFGLSYPKLYWLTFILGGGASTRVLHPWIGLVFSGGILLMGFFWARAMILDSQDRVWLRAIGHYIRREKEGVPPVGKYNAGQKLYYWLQIGLGLVFFITGIPLWLASTSPQVFNTARLVHFAAAALGGMSLIPHIYLATVAYPGTLRSMLYGTVTQRWAKYHHPLWFREKVGHQEDA